MFRLRRVNLRDIVNDLESSKHIKGEAEKKLNKYFRQGGSIDTIKDILLILQKSEKRVPMDFSHLDRKLDLQLTSDIPFLLKLIEINPYIFNIAPRVLKDNILFVMLALEHAQDPKIIYINLNNKLKKDPEVLDFVFPQSKNAYASHVTNNSIQRTHRLYPGRDIIWPEAEEANSQLINFGKKLSPRSAKNSPRSAKNSKHSTKNSKHSTKNLGGGIKKSKKRKTKI